MNLSSSPNTRRGHIAGALIAVLAGGLAHGQTTTLKPTATDTQQEDESIVLTPFVVNAAEDADSYMAKSTLAGTRIRTDLRDVGSAISVATSKFIQDIDARNNSDLLKYTTNTEVGGIGGNFSGVGRGVAPSEPNLTRPNTNTRVRGLTAADNTRDYFLTEIPWDSYNIDRVEIQRGPNSILFGMGSPAGIINNATKVASFRNSGNVEFRVDNEGSTRESFDLNRVLLKQELALRVAGVNDETEYRQKPAFNHDKRYFGAIEYDPAFLKKNGMVTKIRANYERGDINGNRPRSITPYDNITGWWTQLNKSTYDQFVVNNIDSSNRPVLNGVANPTFNPWIGGNGLGNNPTAIFNTNNATTESAFRNWQTGNAYWGIGPNNTVKANQLAEATANNYFGIGVPGAWSSTIEGPGGDYSAPVGVNSYTGYANSVLTPTADDPTHQGLPYKSIGAYKDKTLSDPSVFDFYNKLIDGPNKREWQKFETNNIAVSQTFFDDRLGIEGVYDKQKYRDGSLHGVNNAIYVDINATMPGTAPALGGTNPSNPNVGHAFVVNDNYGNYYNSVQEAKRVTGFAELRFSDFLGNSKWAKILGRHTFTGLYADEKKDSTNLQFVRYALDSQYAFVINGTKGGGSTINGDNRSVRTLTYISGDLSGKSAPKDLNIATVNATQVPTTFKDSNGVSGIYAFDSHWAKPVDPSDPNYVNPAAPYNNTRNTGADFQNQGNNLANYYQFHQIAANPVQVAGDEGAPGLYFSGQKTWRQVKSQAFVWQGHMLDDVIVPTFGWRKDKFKGSGVNAEVNKYNQIDPTDPKFTVDHDQPEVVGQSRSWSVVVHTPKFITQKLPANLGLSLFYNKSDNFQPKPGDVDINNHLLANPQGKTKDYGFVISAFDERVNFKVNWYKTEVTNDRLQGFDFGQVGGLFSSMLQSAYRVRHKDPSNPWKWDYSNWTAAGGQAQAELGAQAVLNAYNTDPVFKSFVDSWGMTQDVDSSESANSSTPPGLNATADTVSKGVEFELQAEPIKGWNLSINASKTNARQVNIGGSLKDWITHYQPLFDGPVGDLRQWWAGDSNNFRTLWQSNIKSQYNLLSALENGDVPDLRQWRFNAVSDYSFNRDIFNGALNGFNVGGAYRWEEGNVVGFPVINGTDVITGLPALTYDTKHPFKGPSESHIDAWVGYGRKNIVRGVDWRIQLNLRDLFSDKKLIPIQVEPDGTVAQYRIPSLFSWSITNTFSF